MNATAVTMPDGTPFEFWDDMTEYTHIYYVACEHPDASDDGPGTEEQPFATIGRAALELKPCQKVIVHGGVYREWVRPARGGEGPDRMIAYEAAPGEEVFVRGSQLWAPEFKPSEDWNFRRLPTGARIWMGELPAERFMGYNPFMTMNFSSEYTTFTRDWSTEEIHCFMLRRGMVFADGRPLRQVFRASDLAGTDGAFWVEDPGLRIHLRLWGDADPNESSFEVTTREQVFAPAEPFLGYIRVSGFHFQHAADGIPIPQRAMVSAYRGHHWIIEDNEIRWANACGIDVGNETWHRPRREASEDSGHHIIRRNHVSDCGICGMAAVGNNAYTLVEDNAAANVMALAGEIDMQSRHMLFSNAPVFQENAEAGGYHVGLWSTASASNLTFFPNQSYDDPQYRALMQDARFRQALSLGLDRDLMNEVGYRYCSPSSFSEDEKGRSRCSIWNTRSSLT